MTPNGVIFLFFLSFPCLALAHCRCLAFNFTLLDTYKSTAGHGHAAIRHQREGHTAQNVCFV